MVPDQNPKPLRTVYIEIGNLCNRACSFCPGTDRLPQTMDDEVFQKALAGAAVLADRAAFHVLGEPLLNPDFSRRVALAADAGVPLLITTNGTLIRPDTAPAEALLDPAVAQVNVSLHALDPQKTTDQEIFGRILHWIVQAQARRPDQYLNLRLWNLPGRSRSWEASDFPQKPFLDRLADHLGLVLPSPLFPAGRTSRRVSGRLYLHTEEVFDWPGTGPDQEKPGTGPTQDGPDQDSPDGEIGGEKGTCRALGDQIAVLADGRVTACCLDRNGELVLGDLHQASLEEIYRGERSQRMLQGFARGILTENLCRRCGYRQRFGIRP